MAKKVTIQDVARRAGVSTGTIDRVLHNRGKVSAEKREKIEKAIEELNFNPNQLARTLALSRSYHISVLIPSAPSPRHYWTMPLHGIRMAEAQYRDYGIAVETHFYDLFNETSFTIQAAKILESLPDAVVMAPLLLNESLMFADKLSKAGIPYIFIDADINGGECLTYIGPEIERSAYIAGRLLHSAMPANREILIVNMVKGYENASALHKIEQGIRNYFNKEVIKDSTSIHTLTINSTSREAVFNALEQFYKKHPDITGVFVTNSKAFLVAEFHKSHNLNIRLVGYDLTDGNIIHLRNGGIDFIISQSPVQQGQRAIQTLFDYFVYNKEPGRVQHVPLDIIIRENVDFYLGFNHRMFNDISRKH